MTDAEGPAAANLEFLVEPFVVNQPGAHVTAAVEVVRDRGLSPEMGPFATTASGNLDDIIAAASDLLRAGFEQGATTIQLRIGRSDVD